MVAVGAGEVSAWKVGTPSRGAEPSAAPIFGARIQESPAQVASGDFHMLAAEVEIAFRIGQDLQPGCTREDVTRAVDGVVVVIELCDTRLQDFKSATAYWKLADNQSNFGLVVGSGRRDWQAIDFPSLTAEFHVNGTMRHSAVGAHPLGSPFNLLPWLASHIERRGSGLRRGNVITTGAWTGLEIVHPGDEVLGRFPGVGEARVTFGY